MSKKTVEVMQNAVGNFRSCIMPVVFNEAPKRSNLARISDVSKFNHALVDVGGKGVCGVEDISDPTTHPCGEISPRGTENDHSSSCHVLAAMVAAPLNDSIRARVANGKSFRDNATDE